MEGGVRKAWGLWSWVVLIVDVMCYASCEGGVRWNQKTGEFLLIMKTVMWRRTTEPEYIIKSAMGMAIGVDDKHVLAVDHKANEVFVVDANPSEYRPTKQPLFLLNVLYPHDATLEKCKERRDKYRRVWVEKGKPQIWDPGHGDRNMLWRRITAHDIRPASWNTTRGSRIIAAITTSEQSLSPEMCLSPAQLTTRNGNGSPLPQWVQDYIAKTPIHTMLKFKSGIPVGAKFVSVSHCEKETYEVVVRLARFLTIHGGEELQESFGRFVSALNNRGTTFYQAVSDASNVSIYITWEFLDIYVNIYLRDE